MDISEARMVDTKSISSPIDTRNHVSTAHQSLVFLPRYFRRLVRLAPSDTRTPMSMPPA
jgi:hypothetical protein